MTGGPSPESRDAATERLVERLADPALYPHRVSEVTVLETHISWVLLAGECVYKIKKPVALAFLDFSTLARRRADCEEELRLNRRYAPEIYLAVVAITGSIEQPRIDGDGPVLEYAVKMRRFPQEARLDHLLAAGALTGADLDSAAATVAAFHRDAAVATEGDGYGEPEAVQNAVRETFDQLAELLPSPAERDRAAILRDWQERAFEALAPEMAERRRAGYVRECHGDLHLGNLVRLDDRVAPFDCIEFNAALRWIDVTSDIAFLAMDLGRHGREDLAFRFVNAYLERTGDYSGLALLRYYRVYRALVRALVALIQRRQSAAEGRDTAELQRRCRMHLDYAERLIAAPQPALVIMSGVSGSGKSRVAGRLAERLPALRVRSDVERKRLFGLDPLADSRSGTGTGLYTADANRRTYAMLHERAREIVRSGYTAVLDATFLKREHRRACRRLAGELGAAFLIVYCDAPAGVLRERVAQRAAAGSDASEADTGVLEHQLATVESLGDEERRHAVVLDTAACDDLTPVERALG